MDGAEFGDSAGRGDPDVIKRILNHFIDGIVCQSILAKQPLAHPVRVLNDASVTRAKPVAPRSIIKHGGYAAAALSAARQHFMHMSTVKPTDAPLGSKPQVVLVIDEG